MVRAIIFDCYGVLANLGWLPFKRHYFADKPELAQQATALRAQVDAGHLSYAEFLDQVGVLAGIPPALVREVVEDTPADAELFEYITRELKPHFKIGLLSNAGSDRLHDLFTPQQLGIFDAAVLSFQINAIKPEPRAYEAIAEKLGLPAEECLMVDDQAGYCDGARAVGMQAICYQDLFQLREALAPILAANQSEK